MRKIITMLTIVLSVFLLAGCNDNNAGNISKEEKPCITFMNNGSEYKVLCVENGEKIEKPEDPIKDGYTFSHWATHEKTVDGSEKFNFDEPVTRSETVFAHYDVAKNTEKTETKSISRYEQIYNTYSERLKNECPSLSITECATISNEGVEKMAEYMYSSTGTDGQYATYNEWAQKLYNVYIQEAR